MTMVTCASSALKCWARSGYQVDAAAERRAAAWDALNNTHYDLLITAHKMPKVSGVELLEKLHAVRRALPVILTSPILPKDGDSPAPQGCHPATTLHMPYTVARSFWEPCRKFCARRFGAQEKMPGVGEYRMANRR